jgi:hypothetical protein
LRTNPTNLFLASQQQETERFAYLRPLLFEAERSGKPLSYSLN